MKDYQGNERFYGIIENISDGIIALDKDWRIIYANKITEKLLNRQPGSLHEKNIWEEFPGSVGNKFYKAYHEALETQKSMVVEDYSIQLEKWIQTSIFPSPSGLTIYFHDITNERTAQINADNSEKNYRLFLDRITDGFIVLDKEFRYVYVNKKIGELVHMDPGSLLGRNVWEVFPDAVNSLTYKAFQTAFKEQRFISNIDYYEPLDLWQENYIYPSPEGLSIFIKDISDRKKLEKELRDQERNQQFELMIATLEAQERERTHMGQELHDNVNQLLVATKLILALAKDDPEKANSHVLSKCISNLEKAIEENRRISHELVTPNIKEDTLVDQLGSLLQTMLAPGGVETVLNTSAFIERALDEPRKLAVYRIAQEQCTNIIKYSKAKKVTVTLSTTADVFTMIIADDGIGMKQTKLTAGIGLRNIGARAGFFGGTLYIDTSEGKGFKLEVNIPVASVLSGSEY